MNMVELTAMVEMVIKDEGEVEEDAGTFQLRVAVTEGSELIPKRHTLNISINR